jgi:hypothetical protein
VSWLGELFGAPPPASEKAIKKEIAKLERVDCEREAHDCRTCTRTFGTKKIGVGALLQANPPLEEFLGREGVGRAEDQFRKWLDRTKRGYFRPGVRRPPLAKGDGRFDSLNEAWELRGPQRVSTWLEACYRTVPASRRWRDFTREQLRPLGEAVGLKLAPPEEAIHLEIERASVEECERRVDERIQRLLGQMSMEVPF